MARALGARVYAGGIKEIGWGQVSPTKQGAASCLAPLAEDGASVLHGMATPSICRRKPSVWPERRPSDDQALCL